MKQKKQYNEEKEKSQILWMIFLVPIVIFIMDLANLGHLLFPYISNLTEKYDWLSFIGTYAGTIVSAIFLLFITKMDRKDNNEILRRSQRPYLEVNWTVLHKDFLDKNINDLNRNLFIYNNFVLDGVENANEYLTLEIKNTGASVAIIDVNQSNFTIEYDRHEGIKNGEEILKREKSNVILNELIKRKSIAAGESMFILFNSVDYYNSRSKKVSNSTYITNTKIYYKDLFDCNYEDECKYVKGKIIPEKDNMVL